MRCLLLLLVLLVFSKLNAQDFSEHIVTKDSTYSQGSVRLIGKGKLEFRLSKISEPVIYSLNDLLEYGTGGSTYEVLTINSKREFYNRYVEGNANLYFKRGTYVLKSGNVLTPFRRKNFRSVIGGVIKCEGSDPSLSKLGYTKPAIKGIIKSYNNEDCNSDLISYRKFGIVAGYSFINTKASTKGSNSLKGTDAAPFAGLFVELPIARKKGIYLNLEATGTAFQPSYYSESPGGTAFMALRIKGINSLANIKFVTNKGRIRPYMKLGVSGSFFEVDCPTGLVTTETTAAIINMTQAEQFNVSRTTQLGFNLATGVEIPIHKRKNVHVELRYSRSIADNITFLDLSLSTIGITAGFNF